MKICFLAHAGSIHTRYWVRYFHDKGHQVSIVTLTPGSSELGVDLYDLSTARNASHERANWHYLIQLPRLWKIVRDIRPDILNAHFLSSYGFLAALVCPHDCPLVTNLHGSDILVFPRRSKLHHLVTRFALKRADLIISVASHVTRMVSTYHIDNGPVVTMQYGVDTGRFFPPPMLKNSRPICLSNRALVLVSNIETILSAARKLQEVSSPLKIVIGGDGEQSDALKQRAAQLQIDKVVSFIGHIDHDNMPEALRSAAIYVSMSLSDGLSLSLMEAMACGVFPVVSDIPANRELIKNGVNGYLVPVDSPELLAQKLIDAWENPQLRKVAAKYNWCLIRQKGDYEKNMSTIEKKLLDLVRQFRSGLRNK